MLTVQESSLTAIADAIRNKTGGTAGLEFPDGFVTDIGTISNTVADSMLISVESSSYLFRSSTNSSGLHILCPISDGVGTFVTDGNCLQIHITFIPLVDLYAYKNSAQSSKVTLTAGTEYKYQYNYDTSTSKVRTQIKQDSTVILDSGENTYTDTIKITKK